MQKFGGRSNKVRQITIAGRYEVKKGKFVLLKSSHTLHTDRTLSVHMKVLRWLPMISSSCVFCVENLMHFFKISRTNFMIVTYGTLRSGVGIATSGVC